MEIFGWILLLVLVLFFWIIFVPFYLKIDTQKNLYQLTQAGIFHFSYMPGERPSFKLRVFGMLVPELKTQKSISDKNKKRKPFVKRSFRTWVFLVKGLFKSFKIIRLVGTADLDDFVLHSQLYALYPFINQGPVQLTSNIDNCYFLALTIEGRLNKMLYTFILFLTKK